jgi:uncharacterized protein YwgA
MGKSNYLLQKMLHMSDKALNIKLRDRWCNIQDLPTASKKFRNKYSTETEFIMNGLVSRNLTSKHKKLINQINQFLKSLNESFNTKRYIKTFEDFKMKNINIDDIISCIENGGLIYTNIVKNYPEHNPEEPVQTCIN